MHSQNAHICEDSILSNTACPKFCNKCPLVCYNCNMTSDTNKCNVNACVPGEVCVTFSDPTVGRQLTLQCANKSVCGTAGLISCCSHPLCNDPSLLTIPFTTVETTKSSIATKTTTMFLTKNTINPTTTDRTTSLTKIPKTTPVTTLSTTKMTTNMKPMSSAKRVCHKDIIFVVDESPSMSSHWSHVKSFAKSLVENVNVDRLIGIRLSFTTFTTTFHTRWHLNSYATASGLERVLTDVRRSGIYRADNLVGVMYANNQALSRTNGNRRDASDVVIFISASHLHVPDPVQAAIVERNEILALHNHYKNVIAIGIGNMVERRQMSLLATGGLHRFFIHSGSGLRTIENRVLQLICD